jgi:hypothetical protein
MRSHGRMGMWASSIVSALALGLMASPAGPNASKTLDVRDQIERKETSSGRAATVSANFTCSWIADRGYMVCEHNDTGKAYKQFGISKDYKPLEGPATIVEGNAWQDNYRKN